MPARLPAETWVTIVSEGGLLQPETLAKIASEDRELGGLDPTDYGLPRGYRLTEAISTVWSNALTHWRSFNLVRDALPASDRGTSDTRDWVQKFLRELGYGRLSFRAAAEDVEGQRYPISHRAGDADAAPPVHIVSFRQDLNRPVPSNDDAGRRAPHLLMQAYLNESPLHLWGIVTNGTKLRLLRDAHHFGRQSYLEFDLEAMFTGEVFSDFVLTWLVLHRSRLPQPEQLPEESWLERWRVRAEADGTRARESLRGGVEQAILQLGNGLFEHPDNLVLRRRLQQGELGVQDFYRQLLRLVYRLLFLLVAEERDLLFVPNAAEPRIRERYERNYSLARLRRIADRFGTIRDEHHTDLWRSLLVTFDGLRDVSGAHALGLEPLSGGLFDELSCRDVCDDAQRSDYVDTYDARPMISNARLMNAIRGLSLAEHNKVVGRVNYRDMDVEELGSVYESLLDQEAVLNATEFEFRRSGERKSTGSYYTPSSLVQELIRSALDPVLKDAIVRGGNSREQQRMNILALKVCDPACGSGHFLLAAARRLGQFLAKVDAGDGAEPGPDAVREATREVIRHCIYGVDKNPLAVDLCKTALWIEGHTPGHPLGYLDSHIKRGDSLIGVFDLEVLETGIPDAAYTAVTGDDKKVATGIRKTNRLEAGIGKGASRSYQPALFTQSELGDLTGAWLSEAERIANMPQDTLDQLNLVVAEWRRFEAREDRRTLRAACDLWTYAFFAPLTADRPDMQQTVPTTGTVRATIDGKTEQWPIRIHALAQSTEVGFFHWPVEFPEVFSRAEKGFDVVLGNPPWEQVQPEEQKYFASIDPEIAKAAGSTRKALILDLQRVRPIVWDAWQRFVRETEGVSKFIRGSERFPLTGNGKINLYSGFAEQLRSVLGTHGRAGVIVPTGIATDDTNKVFFGDLVAKGSLSVLFDFENRNALFPGVHRSYKFSMLVMAGSSQRMSGFRAGFFLLDPAELRRPDRTFMLTGTEIERMNPNTKTVPIFRTAKDADLTAAIYRRVPVLINEAKDENPWGVTFKQGLFNMTSDSHLFRTREQLEAEGYVLGKDGRFRKSDVYVQSESKNAAPSSDAMRRNWASDDVWIPLYEAKLIHQFDHRFAIYTEDGSTRDTTLSEHRDPEFVVIPRYWVHETEVRRATDMNQDWVIGFRNIARNTDDVSSIFTVIPRNAVGHSLQLIESPRIPSLAAMLFANMASVTFDFIVRQKLGGANLSFFIVKQMPVFAPTAYTQELVKLILKHVLELTYTALDVYPFAHDCGYEGKPFVWDEARRIQLKAELDGIYAHLYGLNRADFSYVIDECRSESRKRQEDLRHIHFRSLCLDAYDRFSTDPVVQEARARLDAGISV